MHAPAFPLARTGELRLGPTLTRIFVVGLLVGGLASRLAADEIPVGDLRRPEAHDQIMMDLAAARGIEDDDDYDPDGGTGTTGRSEGALEADADADAPALDFEPQKARRLRPPETNRQLPPPAPAPVGEIIETEAQDLLRPRFQGANRMVPYYTSGKQRIEGYLANPVSWLPGRPAVVVIHEWWGLNEQVRAEARKLGAAGYLVLAVDLYKGRSTDVGSEAKGFMMEARGDMADAKANLMAAVRYLKAQGAGRVGSLGWCMGGMFSLQLALAAGDDLDAAVMYYGHTITEPAKLAPLQAPLLALFGENDEGITPSVPAFRAALDELAKPHAIKIYAGAGHAFANPNNTKNHNAKYARDAWEKTMSFFRTFLVEEE